MWALDPIDGTKGFLRGEQFAVCLALIVDGQVQLGVMGCPNLPVDATNQDGEKGCLFITVKGQGAFQVNISTQFFVIGSQAKRLVRKAPLKRLTDTLVISLSRFFSTSATFHHQKRHQLQWEASSPWQMPVSVRV
jgi:3'-phosphoadenosine 5'-phosphosulfate (PAPS) 3'-phosphatase